MNLESIILYSISSVFLSFICIGLWIRDNNGIEANKSNYSSMFFSEGILLVISSCRQVFLFSIPVFYLLIILIQGVSYFVDNTFFISKHQEFLFLFSYFFVVELALWFMDKKITSFIEPKIKEYLKNIDSQNFLKDYSTLNFFYRMIYKIIFHDQTQFKKITLTYIINQLKK